VQKWQLLGQGFALPKTLPLQKGTLMPKTRQQESIAASYHGRLLARPAPSTAAARLGLQQLGLGAKCDGSLYVPLAYRAEQPAPLMLMLHGAGGNAQHGMALIQPLAEAAGLILLAPDSRGRTWDILLAGYGPDISFIDHALTQVFSRYAVDQARVAIGGFSDGASYALSVGIGNGDLFSHVIAFSPGFVAPARQQGAPNIFVSHGTHDAVLPIEVCSRPIVRQLQRGGYNVRYREFDGPHTVPTDIAAEAVRWLTAG
jgi:phospholipase/carboxylesterase